MRQAERILSEGAAGLPDAELLRVVLGGRDELLACRLLSRGLPSLRRAGPGELLLESGMSATLAARVMAALERSEEHTSELQSRLHLVCRLLLEKKKKKHELCAQ